MYTEEKRDRLRIEPAGDERDRLDRSLVQPLCVVEEIEARLVADCVAKKRENGKAHEKDVRRVATVEPESRLESRSLPIG